MPLMVRLAMQEYFKGDFWKAMREMEKCSHPIGVLNTLRVPRGFKSEEEIDLALERYDEVLTRLENSDRKWEEYFDALTLLETFELPYTGRDVTELLIRVGKLQQRIVNSAVPRLVQPLERRKRDKTRVAYISPHMKAHNGARWAEGWMNAHIEDPELEVYVFNLSERHDFISERIGRKVKAYEHLSGGIHHIGHYIKNFGTIGAPSLGLEPFDGFDVVIHPAIGMSGKATQIAAMRLAPVQMTAWGHPTTSGLDTIDFYLSGDLQEPWNGQEHYLEKLERLPGSGLSYPRIEDGPTDAPTGLPEKYLLIAQNVLKMPPKWDFLYQEVQKRTDLPLVMFGPPEDSEMRRLTERFDALGMEYICVGRQQRGQFLKIVKEAAVSLDTPSWSGGNTTIEAVHFGTPVVTMAGEFMRGRHSYCFLKQAGLDDLIAPDAEGYVSKAVQIVNEGTRLPEGAADPIFDNEEPGRALNQLLKEA